MRHSEHVTNFAQNLGELAGHDILLMRMSDPTERDRVIAEVGTEHIAVRSWFRMVVERMNMALGRGAKEPATGECCRSASPSAPIAQAPRVGQTPSASRHPHAILPPEDDIEHTAHA